MLVAEGSRYLDSIIYRQCHYNAGARYSSGTPKNIYNKDKQE